MSSLTPRKKYRSSPILKPPLNESDVNTGKVFTDCPRNRCVLSPDSLWRFESANKVKLQHPLNWSAWFTVLQRNSNLRVFETPECWIWLKTNKQTNKKIRNYSEEQKEETGKPREVPGSAKPATAFNSLPPCPEADRPSPARARPTHGRCPPTPRGKCRGRPSARRPGRRQRLGEPGPDPAGLRPDEQGRAEPAAPRAGQAARLSPHPASSAAPGPPPHPRYSLPCRPAASLHSSCGRAGPLSRLPQRGAACPSRGGGPVRRTKDGHGAGTWGGSPLPPLPPPATYRRGPGRPAPLPPSHGPAAASPRRVSAHPPPARLHGPRRAGEGATGLSPPAPPQETDRLPHPPPRAWLLGSRDARPTAPRCHWVAAISLKLIPASPPPSYSVVATPIKVSQPPHGRRSFTLEPTPPPFSLPPIRAGGCLSHRPRPRPWGMSVKHSPTSLPLSLGSASASHLSTPPPQAKGALLATDLRPAPPPPRRRARPSGGSNSAPPERARASSSSSSSLPLPSSKLLPRARPPARLLAVSRSPRRCCLRRAPARSAASPRQPGDR